MNRAMILLALWAASPLPGQVGFTALYTQYEYPPSPGVVSAMRSEVQDLLSDSGLRFQWRSLPVAPGEVWSDLAVISFRGHCDLLSLDRPETPPQRLGWTHITGGEVIPFSDVDCRAIRAYVERELSKLPDFAQEQALGKAIGRVLAHELLHVFSRAKTHSSSGVDRPMLTVSELLAKKITLDEHGASQMLRAGTGGPPVLIGSTVAGRKDFEKNGCSSCHGVQAEGTRHGPVLRAKNRVLTTIVLAAKLAKHQKKMLKEAHTLKLAPPSVAEVELSDLVSFLNQFDQ